MREESHLDEMRSAIRGDFERLAERRGDQELMRVIEGDPGLTADDVAPEEPLAEPSPRLRVVPPPAPVVAEPHPPSEPEAEDEAPPERSWVARFFSP